MARVPIERNVRFAVYTRDKFRCRYCGIKERWRILTLDHVIPCSRGGGSQINDLATSCRRCNWRKKDKLLEEIGWVLLSPGTTRAVALEMSLPQLEHERAERIHMKRKAKARVKRRPVMQRG